MPGPMAGVLAIQETIFEDKFKFDQLLFTHTHTHTTDAQTRTHT